MIPVTDASPADGGDRPARAGLGDRSALDGRSTRWDGHRSSRRAELARAATRAVHHRGPDVSMEEIASDIGTSKSILYRYFTDKTGLQAAVGQDVVNRMRESLTAAAAAAGGPRERITAMVSVYLEMVDASPHVYRFVTGTDAAAGALRGFVAEVADLVVDSLLPALREGAEGEPDPATLAVAHLWAAGVVGLVRGTAERWVGARAQPESAEAPGPASDQAEEALAGMSRQQVAAHLTNWLWDGAVGVTRRSRLRLT